MLPQMPLTPQSSLKRKLQQAAETDGFDQEGVDTVLSSSNSTSNDYSTTDSLPLQQHSTQSSPIRFSQTPSPIRSTVRMAQILYHNNSNKNATTRHHPSHPSTFQLEQIQRQFSRQSSRHTPPFPLELLKPAVLADLFIKGNALERYFQRRYSEIKRDDSIGLKPLHRPFVRTSAASVPFSSYLERLFRYCHPEPLHLLAIVAYSERLIRKCCTFVPPTGWHRFVVAAWMVAAKALLGDQYWTNQYWSRVAGISIPELCHLEFEFILLFDWRLQVPIEELTAAWYLIQL